MEPLITRQQVEPPGEHFSEEKTLLEWGCCLQNGDGMKVHLQSILGHGTGEQFKEVIEDNMVRIITLAVKSS